MHTETQAEEAEKQFAQISIPVSQLLFYEKDGWEHVGPNDLFAGVPVTCFVRKKIRNE